MFTDLVNLRVRAGHGGRGSGSFRAQPFEPSGGPDGGNGGAGGDVVFRASREVRDLQALVGRPELAAADGRAGAGGRKEGKGGADLVVKVPLGTAVFDAHTGEQLADLVEHGEKAVVARGGVGGGGNIHRASSINRTPTASGPGEAGERRELRVELRLPADIALIGESNAGKSTLLSALTRARPKIADYPYSTVQPELGVMFGDLGEPITLVELPAGYLPRQLERTRVLAVVTDSSTPDEGKRYQALAGDRPVVRVRTKSDLVAGPKRKRGRWVSAETGVGVDELRRDLLRAIAGAPRRPAFEPSRRRVTLPALRSGPAVTVARRDWGLEVAGARVDHLLERYDLETPGGFDRFQVALDRMGVTAALEEAGALPGDTVRIGEAEFEYQP